MVTVSSREYADLLHSYYFGLGADANDLIKGLHTSDIVWYDVCFALAKLNELDGDDDGDAFRDFIKGIVGLLDQDGLGAIADGLEGELY